MSKGCLVQCSANYMPLSPISFLERAAVVYGDKVSIVYGGQRFSWKETHQRCFKVASAFVHLGISRHDVVAAFAPNIPALYELHFSVPMAGAILCALNIRLDSPTLSLILQQLKAKAILVDHQYIEVVLQALDILSQKMSNPPLLILIPEFDQSSSSSSSPIDLDLPPGTLNYNDLLQAKAEPNFQILRPNNECDPISVSYTSGSTGNPKGVLYSHRAVYLNSLAVIFQSDMRKMPVFLWTVEMFRCNGWCFPWAVAALGGTNICLRNVSAKLIFEAIHLHKVTHMCGAPSILNILADASENDQTRGIKSRVEIIVAGALPAPQILTKVAELGFNVSHGYGMTEALGPAIVTPCKPGQKQSQYNLMMEGVDVKDPNTMESVEFDGKTMGEIMFRGNTLMLDYLENSKPVHEVFKGGWYRTGDLAVRHPDGYIQMKDRARDIIICGGEVISTLEVELNPAMKRILQEYSDIQYNPSDDFKCIKLERKPYEWQFGIRGCRGTEFEGGIYHGLICFPKGYPSKPPSFKLLTENGRFKTGNKIRILNDWQPSRRVQHALYALIEGMPTYPDGEELGSVEYDKLERRDLAIKSRAAPPKFGPDDRQKLIDQIHEYLLRKSPPVPELSPSQASIGTSGGYVVNVSGNTFNATNSNSVGILGSITANGPHRYYG